jgi:hypothetical protein
MLANDRSKVWNASRSVLLMTYSSYLEGEFVSSCPEVQLITDRCSNAIPLHLPNMRLYLLTEAIQRNAYDAVVVFSSDD